MLWPEQIQRLVGDAVNNSSSSQENSTAYKQERLLVVWVLLTRIPEDELVEAWKTHGQHLATFAISILNDHRDPCHLLYIRLIAQVYSRLGGNCPLDLGKKIFESWNRHERKHDLMLTIDVWSSLELLVANHPDICAELSIIEVLWNFYTSHPTQTKSTTEETSINESYPSQEWALMSQTLSGTLQGSDPSYYSSVTLNESILAVFQRHGFEHVPGSLIKSILSWVSKSSESSELPPKVRSLWFEWVLGLFQTLASGKKLDNILRHTGVPDDLNHLLLAIIVSPTSDQESAYGSLRPMAWKTLVSILEACGWTWAFRMAPSGKLGTGTPLCTWTRLASGEWRLQLQSSEGGDASMPNPQVDVIGHATARLLIATTEFCIEISEKSNVSLSADSVLHLYQSLEDSLMSTVEYITLEKESRIVGIFSSTSTHLLATLLREFDIWTLQKKEVETSQAIIDGLVYLLESSNETCLFPAIANILEASHDDETRRKDIIKTWDPFISYVERFWDKTATSWSQQDSSELRKIIPWANACVEWWIDGSFPESKNNAQNRRRIQVSLVKSIDSAMSSNLSDSESRSNLSVLLGCYMTLSQEQGEMPSENESILIFRALQVCEMGVS